MRPVVIIPSRRAATRLPDKPLADIHGTPMILHVWERAVAAGVGEVWVATDDTEIAEIVRTAGGQAVMTDPALPSGSDRVWAALTQIDPQGMYDIAINVQGDLPTLDPAIIAPLLLPLADPEVQISTPVAEITVAEEHTDPAVVKPVIVWQDAEKRRGRALYFSRASLPYGEGARYHHIGLYAFRRAALQRFVSLPPSPLELRERLEQLRALEDGMRIDVQRVDTIPLGVDTPEHLERARRLLA
jgi:3-deoxy-manno-octulosonate cytidylyltransferase (CMP-KDO synthetase)